MAVYVIRRLLVNALVFLLISVGIFVLVRVAPGDPVRMMVDPEQMRGGGAAFIEAKRDELGLDRSIVVQYGHWLSGALHGDFGYSYVGHRPVSAVLGERLGPTPQLMGAALAVALVVSIALGVAAAVRRNTSVDYGATVLGIAAVSVPPFFPGIVGIYLFSLNPPAPRPRGRLEVRGALSITAAPRGPRSDCDPRDQEKSAGRSTLSLRSALGTRQPAM
ncbi:ABC transporter permease [Actinomadura sp. NPDC048394]|uniref:ABC transporter permease n=1 Tax=Actinomadura sp. NPDC048394 TaxID=3158223 RepID=UPI0033CC6DB4